VCVCVYAVMVGGAYDEAEHLPNHCPDLILIHPLPDCCKSKGVAPFILSIRLKKINKMIVCIIIVCIVKPL